MNSGKITGIGWLCILSLILTGLIGHGSAWAKSKEFIKIAGEEEYDLAPYAKILDDEDNALTFEDVSGLDMSARFHQANDQGINFNVDDITHWLRIEIRHIDNKNRFPIQRDWLLDIRRAQLDIVELYIVRPAQPVQKMQSDLRMKFRDRPIINVNSVFPVSTHRGEFVTLYIKIKNKNATYIPIFLRSAPNFIWHDSSQEFLYGLFFGGMAIMILYNVFLLVSIRDISYFYYIAYLAPAALFEFIDAGHCIPLFEIFPFFFNKKWLLFLVWMAMFGGMAFAMELIDVKNRTPAAYVVFKSFCLFLLLSSGISYLIPYSIALNFTAYFASFGSFIIVGCGLYVWYRYKDFNAAMLAGGFLFCDIGYVIYGGLSNGWLPVADWTILSIPLGTLLQAATLAFAMGERIKRAQNTAIDARQESIAHLNKFRSFVENSTEGIYQLGLDGRMISANKSMANILGFETTEELLTAGKKSIMELLFKDHSKQWRSLFETRQTRSEISFVGINGAPRYALHSAKLIRQVNGHVSHIEGTLIDLTERRENELAQRARLKERREREQAKHLTDSKSQFLKDMSYQIRTPLSAIIGFSETLREPRLTTQQRQLAVKTVVHNAQTLLQLVNDILDYSKIEAGKMALEKIDVDLMALLRQVQLPCEEHAREKNLYFRVDYRFPLPARIVSDPTRIRQILNNLCNNAIRTTSKGGVKLQVRWDGIQQRLCFEIEDSSSGLSTDEMRNLNKNPVALDTQSGNMVSRLGIAIARHLCQLLGGEYSFESRLGYGSRVRCSVACRIVVEDEWVKNTALPLAEPDAKPSRSSEIPMLTGRILLAEDNAVNQKLISRLITKTGATVVVAENGKVAMEQALQQPYDLVLMDINMPVMDGLTATRELKLQGFESPIFALTAENGSEELQACITAGCQGYLSKPVDIPEFYATLARFLAPALPTNPSEIQQ